MAKWRSGYDDIKKVDPQIVYISISMFGQYGPYHKRPGFDPLAQAMGGIMYVTGMPGGIPLRTGNAAADNFTGWMAAIGGLSALLCRKETGKGQHVDISLLDNAIYMSDFGLMSAAHTNYHWIRNGNRHPSVSPFNTYQVIDGYVFIIIAPDSHWAKFCRIIGREDLIDDPRCKTIRDRGANAEFVDQITAEWAKEKTVEEIMNSFLENDIPAAPVWNHKNILDNEHVHERGMVAEVEHQAAGRIKLQGVPWKHSLTPGKVRTPAPTLGQHTFEILTNWLGYDQERISGLKEGGFI
jgi:crotonobetainyl-CoA:carnitine CoA-transferase CaiB-like acyl-CoA transferase